MDGTTPLDIDELQELKINIATRKELDDAEFANIARGLSWAEDNPVSVSEMLAYGYICELHLHMFGDVWNWAGKFRKSDKNIGIAWPYIGEYLKNALEDAKTWVEFGIYDCYEIAIRLHHRLVQIHPFVNGNGRMTRIFASRISQELGGLPLRWSGLSLATMQQSIDVRDRYLKSLKMADKGDYSSLIAFGLAPYNRS